MKQRQSNSTKQHKRENERGAALITVMLVSLLLLVVGSALIMTTALSGTTTFDASAESQAYYAAETGLQSALNVLRGRVQPNPLFANPAYNPANQINFRKAVTPATSNLTSESGMPARLSRWLSYNYAPSDAIAPDRVTIGPGAYTPLNGSAYSLVISDPDNSSFVSFTTTGNLNAGANSIAFPNATSANRVVITFSGVTTNNLNAAPIAANQTLGTFNVQVFGTGATITEGTRFSILVNQTAPYSGAVTIRGVFETISGAGATTATSSNVRVNFDGTDMYLLGGAYTLNTDPLDLNAPNSNNGNTVLVGSVTAPEPQRLLLSSTGYGPRGARKQIDMIIRKNLFGSFTAPATITLVGNSTGFNFASGNSNASSYSGNDVTSNAQVPVVGVTTPANISTVNSGIARPQHFSDPRVADVTNDLPDFLTSTYSCDALVNSLKDMARVEGRYYTPSNLPPDVGNSATGQGLTVVDGDYSLQQSGGGILLVTGNLTLRGNFTFKGIILVLGSGSLQRNGGGNGTIEGFVIVAKYNPLNLAAGFSGPTFDTNGGGNSTVVYNSNAGNNAMNSISGFVLGVVER
jgi:hypothetical protein